MTDRELMQQALETLEEINKLSVGENAICLPAEIDGAMDALRKRLAQPEQKPVAWLYRDAWEIMKLSQTTPPPVGAFPVYTTPRPWVGLTDEEIIDLIHPLVMADIADEATDYEIARAIESKLKSKNI